MLDILIWRYFRLKDSFKPLVLLNLFNWFKITNSCHNAFLFLAHNVVIELCQNFTNFLFCLTRDKKLVFSLIVRVSK